MDIVHVPVLLKEVLENLNIRTSGVYVDGTVGTGGHAEAILGSAKDVVLIGIDRDDEALARAKERLRDFKRAFLVRESFSSIRPAVNKIGFSSVDGILLDLGISTLQLKSDSRGFSFLSDELLDMRMDRRQQLTAEAIVNRYKEKELADLFWELGEERFSRRIAKAIVYSRNKKPIRTCRELASIVEKSIGRRGKIHPATRVFQALRIRVNSELDELSQAIEAGTDLLSRDGRFCIISYHSLEDRIVKNAFKKLAKEGILKIITKKPVAPGRDEQRSNPSSRSAKLRVGEKL